MVVVMQEGATEEQIQRVINKLMEMGFDIHRSTGVAQSVLGAVGVKPDFDHRDIELLEGVQEVHRISSPYKLASRQFRPEGSVVQLGKGVAVGAERVVMMAGPCSVESAAQVDTIAAFVAEQGVRVLRGGAFKPRTSPYSFQGLGQEGLELIRKTADRVNNNLLNYRDPQDGERLTRFYRSRSDFLRTNFPEFYSNVWLKKQPLYYRWPGG